jgi:hypothetical protein
MMNYTAETWIVEGQAVVPITTIEAFRDALDDEGTNPRGVENITGFINELRKLERRMRERRTADELSARRALQNLWRRQRD